MSMAVAVRTNSFAVLRAPDKTFYHYDVAFEPPARNADQRRRLIERLQVKIQPNRFNPACPYDGTANLFSMSSTLSGKFAVPFSDREGSRVCDVSIRLVATIDPKTMKTVLAGNAAPGINMSIVITLLNILIRHGPTQNHAFNSKSFFPGREYKELGGGLQVWRGYFQSVRPTQGRLLINVDVTAAVMYRPGSLLSCMMDFFGYSDVKNLEARENSSFKEWERFVKKLKIRVKYGRAQQQRAKIIRGLCKEGARFEFDLDNGEHMTVQNYIRRTYSVDIQYPRIVAVQVGSSAIIPLEFCEILPGQFYKRKIPSHMTKVVVDFTNAGPTARLQDIEKGVPLLDYNNSPVMRQSGMQVDTKPITVNGKMLTPPVLRFGSNSTERPRDGAWNLLRHTLLEPSSIISFIVIVFDPHPRNSREDVAQRISMLIAACHEVGMSVPPFGQSPPIVVGNGQGRISQVRDPPPPVIPGDSFIIQQIKDAGNMAQAVFGRLPNLVIAVLPVVADSIRKGIKQFGDIEMGVATQCLRVDKLFTTKGQDQYFKNVALKINAKLGGVNSCAEGDGIRWIKKEPTMILGADVSHPSPGSYTPSVSALVSSLDDKAARYVASSLPQESRVEKIQGLGQMFEHALTMFHQFNFVMHKSKIWPSVIVFFRDGLSEGEFDDVAQSELQILRDTLDRVWLTNQNPSKRPKILYLVAIKRHHVRFFPQAGVRTDRSGNVPSGFVAEKDVTGPKCSDWFLQSHGGLKGTSRPTHYEVIVNDMGLAPELIQNLVFDLCHNYARATRSVSIPAPVYYADIVCSRAKFHTGDDIDFSDTASDSANAEHLLKAVEAAWRKVHANSGKNMYWM